MGCFVNGPGEAGHADVGIAGGGDGEYYVFRGEERIMKVREEEALDVFRAELQDAYLRYDPDEAANKVKKEANWQTATKDAEKADLAEHLSTL